MATDAETADAGTSGLPPGGPVRLDAIAVWIIPAVALLAHLITYAGYGYFRDELYYLACGEHLAFGYVDHPPLVALVAAGVRATLGDSLFAIRLVPAILASLTVLVSAAIARELGGARYAQVLAALSAMLVPGFVGLFGIFTMNAIDVFIWALLWWIVARYLRTGDERLWLAFGVVAGIGLQNKVSVMFLGFGVAAGLIAARRWEPFRTKWLWLGGAVAALIFLPHILWQVANGWPTLEFMRNAVEHKNVAQPLSVYLGTQALNTLPALPVWLAGLAFLLFAPSARAYRALGWAYVVVLAVMLSTNAKAYYLMPAYSMLFAAGGVAFASIPRGRFGAFARGAAVALVVVLGLLLAPFAKAVLPVETFVAYARAAGVRPPVEERHRMGRLPQLFADMHGWPEFAETIARVYSRLPAAEQAKACIYVENYGQAGAIDFFGRRLGLPPAISGHNSYFLWGPRGCTGAVVLIVGGPREEHVDDFKSLELGATFRCADCMPYEDDKPIWIGRGLLMPLSQAWPETKHFE